MNNRKEYIEMIKATNGDSPSFSKFKESFDKVMSDKMDAKFEEITKEVFSK